MKPTEQQMDEIRNAVYSHMPRASALFGFRAVNEMIRHAIEAYESTPEMVVVRNSEKLFVAAIIATETSITGRLMCDVQALLEHYNAAKDAAIAREGEENG